MPPGSSGSGRIRSLRFRRRRLVIAGAAAVLILGLAVFGRSMLAWCTRQKAARQITAGAISAAQWWLDWSAWFDPSDGRTDLMRATCLRRRCQRDAWEIALESAQRNGAPARLVEQERRLGLIQAGKMNDKEHELTALLEAGVSVQDAGEAFVRGYLVLNDALRAEIVLKAWAADLPDDPHYAYVQAFYWLWLRDRAGELTRRSECRDHAEKEFNSALALEPRHELAREALAGLLEEDDRLVEALREYATLVANGAASDSAKLGVVRMLRSLGRLEQARRALNRFWPSPGSSADAAAEMGQIELESGNSKEAQNWFTSVDLSRAGDGEALLAAATAFAVEGKTRVAERLFARLDGKHADRMIAEEIETKLAIGLRDPKAADELRRLTAPNARLPAPEALGEDRPATSADDLYAEHCSGCHGTNGDGNGRGARHLFPRPRDFRTESLRLVSSLNGAATLDDVVAVIERGMPGTSMRAYDGLNAEQRALLAQEVLRMRRDGLRAQLRSEEQEIDAAELERAVEFRTTPGKTVSAPALGPGGPQAIARGKDQYFALGCHHCHGKDGTGDGDTPCYDERGRTCPPRDLVRDPLKGGTELESMYRRVVLGMPGTPHPSCSALCEDELVDLIHYCSSLSREPKRVRTNRQRALQAWTTPSP